MKIEDVCNTNYTNVAVIVIFILSFLLFRYIAARKEPPQERIIERMKQAEEYFNRHLIENEDFFLN
jgi:hypothetical protein